MRERGTSLRVRICRTLDLVNETRWFRCAAWVVALATGSLAREARADEPRSDRETRLFDESAEITNVADAFDPPNWWDIRGSVGFRQFWKHANIRRESTLTGVAGNGFVATNENVASFKENTSILDLKLEIGIYKDLAAYVHLPLVMANSRELSDLNGSSQNAQRFLDPSGAAMFGVPFKSPTRSGLDQLAVGLHYDITNQTRSPWLPTWLVGLEARFAIGPRLHACNDGAAVKCPDPSKPGVERDPGISRGMNAYVFNTVVSRRMGYVEPYFGMRATIEDPQSNSDYGTTLGAKGNILTRPPIVGASAVGVEIVPWERREAAQRVSVDVRVTGEYHSPGRDYSEMFDALGSSQAPTLRAPVPNGYKASPADATRSIADPAAGSVFFTGITDQHAYTTFSGALSVTWQANELLKFNAGGGLTFASSHAITAGDACNSSITNDAGASGPCRSARSATQLQVTGIPNPNYRAVIDAPGHRFIADDTTIVHLNITGTLMF